jgi:hypothetical protein
MSETAPTWTVVADPEHGFSIRIPSRTPSDQSVTIDRAEREGVGRLHAHTPDGTELYVEVVAYPGLIDRREAAVEQRRYLSERDPECRLSRVRAIKIGSLVGLGFLFTGTLGDQLRARRFSLVDTADRTFRIVYDPTSALSRAVLRTLTIDEADGS